MGHLYRPSQVWWPASNQPHHWWLRRLRTNFCRVDHCGATGEYAAMTMQPNKSIARDFVAALTGDASSIIRLKFIPDTPEAKADNLPVEERYGTVDELWDHIAEAQAAGYGVYVFVQAMKALPGHVRGK